MPDIRFVYLDDSVAVVVKAPGMLSTDEPGGVPEVVRAALGDPHACVRTVHRLDRVVGGLMVLARTPEAASLLSEQIRIGTFEKEYLAIVHGILFPQEGTMRDLLRRDPRERKTYVTDKPGKDAREAVLEYRRTACSEGLSMVRVHLITGRTHQIRAQFSSRGYPLWGDRKYSCLGDPGDIALWSCKLCFLHPVTNEQMHFDLIPPKTEPWIHFEI